MTYNSYEAQRGFITHSLMFVCWQGCGHPRALTWWCSDDFKMYNSLSCHKICKSVLSLVHRTWYSQNSQKSEDWKQINSIKEESIIEFIWRNLEEWEHSFIKPGSLIGQTEYTIKPVCPNLRSLKQIQRGTVLWSVFPEGIH